MLSSRSLSRVVLRLKSQNRCLSSTSSNVIVKSLYNEGFTVPDCSITDFCFENSKKWLNKTAVVSVTNHLFAYHLYFLPKSYLDMWCHRSLIRLWNNNCYVKSDGKSSSIRTRLWSQ